MDCRGARLHQPLEIRRLGFGALDWLRIRGLRQLPSRRRRRWPGCCAVPVCVPGRACVGPRSGRQYPLLPSHSSGNISTISVSSGASLVSPSESAHRASSSSRRDTLIGARQSRCAVRGRVPVRSDPGRAVRPTLPMPRGSPAAGPAEGSERFRSARPWASARRADGRVEDAEEQPGHDQQKAARPYPNETLHAYS